MSAHLARGKLNIGLIQEKARKEFLDLLDKCEGTKTIIWDDGLSGPFGLISEYSLLRSRDVSKMHPLRSGELHSVDTENVIYVTRPLLTLMQHIVENIRGETLLRKKSQKTILWHIFFVPMKSLLCMDHLKRSSVYHHLTTIEEIPHSCLFPIDNDVISMEIDDAFKDCYIDNDSTCLFRIAKSILLLQDIYGPIKRVCGKGDSASQVFKLMNKLSKESQSLKGSANKQKSINCQIDQLLLLDRNIDLLSPFVTQLTYEGLIDELFDINNCTVKLPYDKFVNQDEIIAETVPEKKSIILNSADEIFSDIRDKNFNAVGQVLSRKAKHMSSQLDERHSERTLQEMKQFVAKLPQLLAVKKSLATHMTIAEMIKERTDNDQFMDDLRIEQEMILGIDTDKVNPYIEDSMAHKRDLIKILRLICMQSAVNSGLKPKVLEQYKRDIIQTYGFQHILTLNNLEKAGLLKTQQGARSFTVLRKTLKLTTTEEHVSDAVPRDISYVYGIYAPLTVRLAQYFAKSGSWRNLSDVISLMPGAVIDQPVNHASSVSAIGTPFSQRRGSISSQTDSTKVILVFFIGGCTFAEISALRYLSQQEELNVEFVIATTKLINGKSFLMSLMESLNE